MGSLKQFSCLSASSNGTLTGPPRSQLTLLLWHDPQPQVGSPLA
jgi:hypothetical protein